MLEAAKKPWLEAPSWAMNAGILGKTLVLVALTAFLASIVCWFFSAKRPALAAWGKRAFILGGFCLFGTIVCLGSLFAHDQFEYTYVFSHGDANTELKYKIAGIWSGQQGSFLLWACTSSIFGILAARTAGIYRRWFTIIFAIFLATLCGILSYETPFEIADKINGVELVAPMGAGLTPSLQNYWVIIHPPTIFMGFGSLTVGFAFGLAAMLTRNVKDWIQAVRPWVILSTAILGLGLSMGGFWAYETLGWGGFWMWDPVENVSFVPWIFSIALLHGFIVQASRKRWVNGNLALAGLPFVVFCYGTFLTRSGFLADASVHSFAEMNRSALWILATFVVLAAVGYYCVYGFLGVKLAKAEAVPANPETGVDREGLYQSGVLLLSGLAAAVAIGMSVPFYLSLANKPSKVVEEPLYHQVVVWFFVPILVLMGIAPFVGWRKSGWGVVLNKLINVFAVTFGLLGFLTLAFKMAPTNVQPIADATVPFPKVSLVPGAIVMVLVGLACLVWTARRAKHAAAQEPKQTAALALNAVLSVVFFLVACMGVVDFINHFKTKSVVAQFLTYSPPLFTWVMLLVSVCVFCFVANAWRIVETFKRAKMSTGGFIAHMGVATLLAGLIISRGLQKEDSVQLFGNEEGTTMGYAISFKRMSHPDNMLDRNNKAIFDVSGPNGGFEARPGLYYLIGNDGKEQTIVWPHVEHMGTHDLYFALEKPTQDVWDQPESIKPGETSAPKIRAEDPGPGPIAVTYNGYKMTGKGGIGTKFTADLVVKITDKLGQVTTHTAQPTLEVTKDGPLVTADQLDDLMCVSLEGLNASDKSALIQMHFNQPIYQLDIYYKPMVALVWLGAVITFLGGALAAFSRRPLAKSARQNSEEA